MEGNILENDSNVLHYYCTCSYVDISNLLYDVQAGRRVSLERVEYITFNIVQDSKQMFLTWELYAS